MATDNDGGYMPVADVEEALPDGIKNYLRVKILNKAEPGVQSVTGNSVDNTDPLNPVVNDKAHFAAITTDTVNIGIDAANPSFFPGMVFSPGTSGFNINPADGAVQNNTGRTLVDVIGTVSFQPSKAGGGTTVLHLASQSSSNGVDWSINPNSLRVVEVSNTGETFKTSLSLAFNWPDQVYIRFVCYAFSGGAISFVSPSDTIGGDPVIGASVAWELSER